MLETETEDADAALGEMGRCFRRLARRVVRVWRDGIGNSARDRTVPEFERASRRVAEI